MWQHAPSSTCSLAARALQGLIASAARCALLLPRCLRQQPARPLRFVSRCGGCERSSDPALHTTLRHTPDAHDSGLLNVRPALRAQVCPVGGQVAQPERSGPARGVPLRLVWCATAWLCCPGMPPVCGLVCPCLPHSQRRLEPLAGPACALPCRPRPSHRLSHSPHRQGVTAVSVHTAGWATAWPTLCTAHPGCSALTLRRGQSVIAELLGSAELESTCASRHADREPCACHADFFNIFLGAMLGGSIFSQLGQARPVPPAEPSTLQLLPGAGAGMCSSMRCSGPCWLPLSAAGTCMLCCLQAPRQAAAAGSIVLHGPPIIGLPARLWGWPGLLTRCHAHRW